ncbi:MAG: SDR family NAD(P)-dependent oxidoreductase [Bacteroidetes bacterium]|nr:SDR family NAD(P)-dependent oxidoreductase [Bacteroidota bacterium]
MKKLDGKIAMVTGRGSGIGQRIALCFAREGAQVIIFDLTQEQPAETANRMQLHRSGPR